MLAVNLLSVNLDFCFLLNIKVMMIQPIDPILTEVMFTNHLVSPCVIKYSMKRNS